ncbi:butyrophilin-like protein 2 isoform X1 [Pangasianodon hypophthalmus]|uniref:butyrophilin-like protein 2 isoform X1 n=1 Tax=Pangasianodon hypophthalmus TaxID=310915 RepID=UPI002306E717|nr:butyrophilin-like protein 2 isoform X1 [Pangasianodon hypophthalmus]XP_053098187.1 butyrophilin-like protein 2 isoform X1 [Pangasianodon hypophthalmus]
MASANLLFFVLMLSSVRVGRSSESLFKLKCQPAVGVIGQTTHISCSIELYTKPTPVVINTVTLLRSGEKKPCFAFQPFENIQIGDSRFEVENGPSLQLHNTAFSDEGEYWYLIRTNLGQDQVQFTINVTAKYSNPIITSVQKEIVNDGAADLYCSANGGYPAGTIHWFDQSNTNWTKSATLQSTQGNDGLFTLSSKLSFQKIDSLWAPFRCVVLNNRYEEEGGTTSTLEIKAKYSNPIITSVQKEIVNDGAADLYCSASGGYPAGTIHWFDQSNTNWTKSATLQSTQGNDGLFTLSSNLSFQKIDSLWAPFRCVVLNNRYEEEGGTTSTLEIKAKYSNPIITSVQKEIVNDGAADLYCSANGGYPAGTIHWFDQSNTNWTKSATLQSTQGNDGLFTLSSKLSFQKIDLLWAHFRCVVLNNKYEEEGGTTSTLEIEGNYCLVYL